MVTNFDIADNAYRFLLHRFEQQRLMDSMPDAGGRIRTFSGETVEKLTRLIWTSLAEKHGIEANIVKGDYDPITVCDADGNYVEESVDQHCYIGEKLVLAVEDKTYLDKCYMQRADSDFALMRGYAHHRFGTAIFALENSINDNSFRFFMNRGNIDDVFFFADGKHNAAKGKRIYNTPTRLNRKYILDAVKYMDSFFVKEISGSTAIVCCE